jgi:hypothetical protein
MANLVSVASSNGTAISSTNPFPTSNADGTVIGAAPLGAGTDRSGAITLGGTAQTLAAANTARVGLEIQNIDPAEEMWVNENGGTAAANTQGSNFIAARGSVTVSTNRAISVVAATTGHKWTAIEL